MYLLSVKHLTVHFHTRNGIIRAVDDVSFDVGSGETLAIVGESGSGKSVAVYSLLDLIPRPPGKIESGIALFEGINLIGRKEKELQKIRGNDIAIIFQDPMTSLNPYLTIGEQLMEPIIYHQQKSRKKAKIAAINMLSEVGIKEAKKKIDNYPHEFSGGMQQRVMIAMALIAKPKLLICDEPTTALDVTTQAQIIKLIQKIQIKYKIAVVFISHDLGVVAGIANNIVVMRDGKIVEKGTAEDIFYRPKKDYTKSLLSSVPSGQKISKPYNNQDVLLRVKSLVKYYASENKSISWLPYKKNKEQKLIKAVDCISFEIKRGEIFGVVGESGSGKSTLGRSILQLTTVNSGEVYFNGTNLMLLSYSKNIDIRKRMQMVFQDPYSSLNPRMTVFDILAEPMLYHSISTGKKILDDVYSLMDDVGLPKSALKKYPHEFSGGQRQRIAIARAIATKPEFIVADEPVSALDVTVQAQILELLLSLVEKHNLTMMFISHDLSVVRYISDRIAVIHQGKLVELGKTGNIFSSPSNDYTKQLLLATPLADPIKEKARQSTM